MAAQHHNNHDHDSDGSDSDGSSVDHASHNNSAGAQSNRPPPKKRNRAALSCTLCRERKVKCDRVIPCQQCIKRGDAAFCHLDPTKRGPDGKRKGRTSQPARADTAENTYVPSNPYGAPMTQPTFDTMANMGQRQPSISSPSASSSSEVDAIKARLAQLEQVLAQRSGSDAGSTYGQMPVLSESSAPSGLSPRYPWQGAGGSFTTSPMNQTMNSVSPASNQHHRGGSGTSPAQTGFAAVFAQQQRQQQQGSTGSSPSHVLSAHSHRSDSGRSAGQAPGSANVSFLSQAMPDSPRIKKDQANRGEVDSDTEDAALVLEGLAMGRGSECDGKKTMKPERAALEIIEKAPLKSIQGFVDEDRAEDIMTEGKYRFEKMSKVDHGIGGACSGPRPEDDKESIKYKELRAYLQKNPDAVFGPDGQRLPPAQRVCVLLKDHESLFNLVAGPETFLGWGLGWAFTAAEAAGDMMSVSEVVGCKGALQREAVLRAIIRSLPEREMAEHLVDVFDSRVKFLAGNCFHIPTFRKEMSAFYDLSTVEKRARVINFVDPAWLSLMLMIFVLALHFHPCERPEVVQHLFDGRTIHLWRSAAQTALVLARYQSSSSMAVLQTVILINLLAMGQGKENFSLTNTAISNALEMGLHRLGDKDQQPKQGESPAIAIRREMAKRIWHQLTFTDWCSAALHAGAYRIHPHQFNTPLPGNYNDTDLCKSPRPEPRPESEHTDMSFSLFMLKLADISRQNTDMIYSGDSKKIKCSDMAYLDTTYRGLLEQAPSFYKIGSDEGAGENIEVERWLFQQSVFHKLLRLHRPQLSSRTSARTSCVLLARSILDMQRRIRSRCSVVDRLFVNLAQSFSAAIVLCLDLLQTRPSATMRSIVRGEIFEALKALRHVGASHHTTENSIRVIEALLEEEEARWNGAQGDSTTMTGTKRGHNESGRGERRKDMLNLALRVAKAAHGEGQGSDDVDMADGERANSSHGSLDDPSDPMAMQQQIKDQQSRQMFDQLLAGRPTFADPSSFSNAPFQANLFDQPQSLMAPNGLDFGFTTSPTENGQLFDLSKFLAEAETNSSPGTEGAHSSAASDSGHSSLHNGRAGSASTGRMSHSSSFSNGHMGMPTQTQPSNGQGTGAVSNGDASASPVDTMTGLNGTDISPSAYARPSTTLDGFWNWVLTQGAMGLGASLQDTQPQPPLGQSQTNAANGARTNAMPAVPSTSAQQAQFIDALAQNVAGGMGGNPVPVLASSDANSTSHNAAAVPFAMPHSRAESHGLASQALNSGTAGQTNATELPFYSVGTPSAGMGNSWMSTPGLFDFAYEFGGEGPSNSQTATQTSNVSSGVSA